MKITWTIALACLVALTGCTHSQYQGGTKKVNESQVRICLPPYFNATDDDHAARALTEITASALMSKGIPLVQNEPVLVKIRQENAAGADGLFIEAAKSLGATHLLIGTVHEYRYIKPTSMGILQWALRCGLSMQRKGTHYGREAAQKWVFVLPRLALPLRMR